MDQIRFEPHSAPHIQLLAGKVRHLAEIMEGGWRPKHEGDRACKRGTRVGEVYCRRDSEYDWGIVQRRTSDQKAHAYTTRDEHVTAIRSGAYARSGIYLHLALVPGEHSYPLAEMTERLSTSSDRSAGELVDLLARRYCAMPGSLSTICGGANRERRSAESRAVSGIDKLDWKPRQLLLEVQVNCLDVLMAKNARLLLCFICLPCLCRF